MKLAGQTQRWETTGLPGAWYYEFVINMQNWSMLFFGLSKHDCMFRKLKRTEREEIQVCNIDLKYFEQ